MSELKNVHTGIDRSKVRFALRLKLIKPIELSKAEYERNSLYVYMRTILD